MFSPFEQFELNTLVPLTVALPWTKSNLADTGVINLSFTNSSYYTIMIVITCFALSYFVWNSSTVIPKSWQTVLELVYSFILGLVTENIGKGNLKYFPFLYLLMLATLPFLPFSF